MVVIFFGFSDVVSFLHDQKSEGDIKLFFFLFKAEILTSMFDFSLVK